MCMRQQSSFHLLAAAWCQQGRQPMQTAATTKLQQAARLRPQAVPLLHTTVRLITRRSCDTAA